MDELNWDRDFAYRQTGGNREFLGTLLDIYRQTLTKGMAEINSGVDCGNAGKVAAAAHAIKGASLSIGMEGIRQTAYQVEMAGKEGAFEKIRLHKEILEKLIAKMMAFSMENDF